MTRSTSVPERLMCVALANRDGSAAGTTERIDYPDTDTLKPSYASR